MKTLHSIVLILILFIGCSEKEGFKNRTKNLGDLNPNSNNLDLLLDTFDYIVIGHISGGTPVITNYSSFDSVMNLAAMAMEDSLNYQTITFDSAFIFDTNVADSGSLKELRMRFLALNGEGESEAFYISIGLFRLGNDYNLPDAPIGGGGWLKSCLARYSCTGCVKIPTQENYDCECTGGQEIDERASCVKSTEVNRAIFVGIFKELFFVSFWQALGWP